MDVEALISSIFVRNPLWDQRDAQHHNRFVFDKLWDAVANEMKSTRSFVRTKWKNLRDSFRKELKKMPLQLSGDGASFWKSSWPHFESLCFLKDQFLARASTGNLPDAEDVTVLDRDKNSQGSKSNTQYLDNSSSVDRPPLANSSSQNKGSYLNLSTSTAEKCKRKQTDSDVGTALIRLEEEILQILEKHHNKSRDEDESFFQSLSTHIRSKLTPQRKMLFRIKMQELVYNCVYGPNGYNASLSTLSAPNMDAYETNPSQLIQMQPPPHDYSNPPSVRSYISNFSEDAGHEMY